MRIQAINQNNYQKIQNKNVSKNFNLKQCLQLQPENQVSFKGGSGEFLGVISNVVLGAVAAIGVFGVVTAGIIAGILEKVGICKSSDAGEDAEKHINGILDDSNDKITDNQK